MLLTEEVYRPRKSVASLPLIAPATLAFFVFSERAYLERIFWIVTAISVAVALVIFILLRAIEIRLSPEGITFRAINGVRVIRWTELEAVEVRWVHTGKSSRRELVFRPRSDREARLNTGLYSRRSLQAIASAAIMMAPQAAIDNRVRRFAKGNFSWFSR
ncbi:hypothetical protein EPD60_03915 [Flaviaesturariibacter flavus]|uniref:PH domain-containing protein n=1 Tax=Flaviaesturariibacter flavus TaxID=2502780 RepID=A0A4R1BML7_9BACT|nr:hypothetical protein [Flaviaesturariibacter flavus]TCJ18655.1 hypothetical protein EPD60_03915 [Flaviaesturariibacter flavus]